MGFLGEPKREDHYHAGDEKHPSRCGSWFKQITHHEGFCRTLSSRPDLEAVPGCDRHTHKVHQVIAGKCKSERKRTRENDDLEDVDAEERNADLEENRKAHKECDQNGRSIGVDPVDPLRTHEGGAFGALHDEEVDDGGNRKGTVNSSDAFIHAFEAEGEKESREVLDNGAGNKGNNHRDENA